MLTVGSVVYLKNGTKKMVVLGNCPIQGEKYFDYIGGKYPIGMTPDEIYFFNEENIEEVLFEGYKDETGERYLSAINTWKEEFALAKGNVVEEMKEQQKKILEQKAKISRDKLFN